MRQINVLETVDLPKDREPMKEKKAVIQVQGLGLRGPYTPFGSDGDVSNVSSTRIISQKPKRKKKLSLGIGATPSKPDKKKRRRSSKGDSGTPKKSRRKGK